MAAINLNSLKSEIRLAVINDKANACPMVARLAWHASGTYDKNDGTGGSDGATMRFDPEDSEDANKVRHPELSYADLWVVAGCMAIEFLGGPAVPFNLGRTDAPDGSHCPAIGRLPDANQGAQHLRDVFYRMGFNDREIVALSGAHTLGRYQDKETGKLMMLPTDLALIEDRGFRPVVEEYARDQATFFKDFAAAFAKLLSLGCPAHCQPDHTPVDKSTDKDRKSSEFRELCMHGSLEPARNLAPHCDVGASEPGTGRTAVHKAAFWGHVDVTKLLVELRAPLDAKDSSGDTALHDAARFGHAECVSILLSAGANPRVRNNEGLDVVALAMEYKKPKVVAILKAHRSKL